MRYRKKPIEVDAFRLTADVDILAPKWFMKAVDAGRVYIDRSINDGYAHVYGATIETREGRMKAKIGDYIIRGVNGEIYLCKPDIFKKTYEPVRGGEEDETESHKAVCG